MDQLINCQKWNSNPKVSSSKNHVSRTACLTVFHLPSSQLQSSPTQASSAMRIVKIKWGIYKFDIKIYILCFFAVWKSRFSLWKDLLEIDLGSTGLDNMWYVDLSHNWVQHFSACIFIFPLFPDFNFFYIPVTLHLLKYKF